MSEVGDTIEVTYSTAPTATVTMSWMNRDTGVTVFQDVPVAEALDEADAPTGKFPVALSGTTAGTWEARFTSAGAATSVESFFERFEVIGGGPVPLATLGEYTEIYGSLSQAREATARALLRRASTLIRDSYPTVDDKLLAGTVSRNTVGQAVLNMTARVMRNPAGLRSETTGPFSRSFDIDAASGMLELSESDRALLSDAGLSSSTGRRKGRIGVARVAGGLVPRRRGGRWPRGGDW